MLVPASTHLRLESTYHEQHGGGEGRRPTVPHRSENGARERQSGRLELQGTMLK